MKPLRRATPIVVLAAVSVMVAFQLVGGPARYVIVSGHSMEPTLRSGDLALLVRHDSYRRGDVVAYRVPTGNPGAGGVVIHRVIGGSRRAGYVTEGDNRSGEDIWRPKPDDVIGKMMFRIPAAGLMPAALGSPLGLGIGAGIVAFLLVAGDRRAKPGTKRPAAQPAPAIPVAVGAPAPVLVPVARAGRSPLIVISGIAVGAAILVAARAARSRRASSRPTRP